MPTFGPDTATCRVLTFRHGLLSALGHDLLLEVTQFTIDVAPGSQTINARFGAASLRVVSAMRRGEPSPEQLRAADKREIEDTIRTVLRSDRHPDISFTSTAVSRQDGGYEVRGRLTVSGSTREIVLPIKRDATRLLTEVRLRQPDFGIRPYSAMAGALRVSPEVVVRASIPATAAPP